MLSHKPTSTGRLRQLSTTRGVLITAAGSAIPPAVMLLTQILLANSLGVAGRGVVAAATAPLMLAIALLTLGLPEALTHFVARSGTGRLTRPFFISALVLFVAGGIGMAAITLVAAPLSDGDDLLRDLILLASLALIPGLLTAALRGVAYGAHHWWLVTIERSLSAFVQLFGVFALFVGGTLTPTTATLAIAASTFAGAAVYLLSPRLRDALRSSDSPTSPSPSFVAVASYGWQIWIGSSAGVILTRLDQVLMTPLAGVEQLGIYVVAVNVSNVALLFNSAVAQVMFAVESGAPSTDRIGRAARMSTLATAVVAFAIASLSPWLIPILFGDAFATSAPIVAILLLSIVLGIPGSVAGAALSGRGRPGLRSLALLIAMVLYIAAMLVLVPPYGAVGAAFAMLAGTTAPYLCIFWLHKFFDVPLSEFYRFRKSDVSVLLRRFR
ncbi:MAG: oligosaccharide flippase family protein [Mycolicibacterium neoaurum]|uniref:oligosaccharide flippase family protein n=1 Tax=Mycolicibacterium neoaurum TaxID=1795 RepID=UPI002FF4B574